MTGKYIRNVKLIPAVRTFGSSSPRKCQTLSGNTVKWEDAKPYESIPGPKPLPIPNFGNYWRFTKVGPYGNLEPEKMMMRLKEEFGDIVRITGIGQRDMIFLYDQNSVEKMFRHEQITPVRHSVECFKYYQEHHRRDVYTNLGLGMLQGEEWREVRSALNPLLMLPSNVKPYLKLVEPVAEDFIKKMRKLRDDKMEMPPSFADELAKCSLESLSAIFLGERHGFLRDEKSEEALRLINAIRLSFELSFYLDFMPSFWKYVSTPAWRKFVECMDIITDFTYDCVVRKCEEIGKRGDSKGDEPRSLVEAMIRSKSMKFAVVTGTDLLSAGVDNVSTAVGIAVLHLANHPDKQKKLFDELKRVLPEKDTPITDAALNDMRYLKAVLKESFRLRPVAPGNSRTTATDLVLGGYKVPKGTKLLSLGSIISVDERYFKEPEKFIPERWLKSDENPEITVTNSSAFANTPFGFGMRMCIGRRIADLQMQTLTAKIIRNFDVSYHYGDMEWRLALFLKPVKPLTFRMADRPN